MQNRETIAKSHAARLASLVGWVLVAVTLPFSTVQANEQTGERFVELDGERFPALEALSPPPIPVDNPQTVDAGGWPLDDDPKVNLGRLLFFEPALSGDGSVPCSTCHKPDEGWGLNSAISRGYPGVSHWRNSHTVVNSAYQGKLFWDGHSLSLETQAPSAAQGLSGNGKADMMEQRLRLVPQYRKMFKAVFGSDNNVVKDAWRAIAAFERTLTQPDTPFDRYVRGDKSALTEQQLRGQKLFVGKARCIICHNDALTSDESYYNLGVPLQESFTENHLQQIGHRAQTYIRGVPEHVFRQTKADLGLYLSSHNKEDMGKFRTQPLRYMEFTAPYMHNGVFDTLEEVVDFYNEGGGKDQVLNDFGFSTKSKRLKKLDLSDEEKEDLVAFLDAFSGEEILLTPPELPKPPTMVIVSQ